MVRAFVRGDRLVQVFDSGAKPAALDPPVKARAYIYHRGGVLRFGKLTMDDADLELLRAPQAGAFEFSLFDYRHQLVSSYSKYTQSLGLIVYMPDYWQVRVTSTGRGGALPGAGRPVGR